MQQEKDLGLPAHATEFIGALAGMILAYLQRFVVVKLVVVVSWTKPKQVWVLGALMGVLAFIAFYLNPN